MLVLGVLASDPDPASVARQHGAHQSDLEAGQDNDHRASSHLANTHRRRVDQGWGPAQRSHSCWLRQEKQVSFSIGLFKKIRYVMSNVYSLERFIFNSYCSEDIVKSSQDGFETLGRGLNKYVQIVRWEVK